MKNVKEPKTFNEQIEILKSRGLIIENEEEAKFILSNINYYRFTAYLITFKEGNNSNNLFIKHHNEKYDGKLPIWVATEIMSFGMISKLYANLLPKDKGYIKNNLCNVNPKLVTQWLQALTIIRNQCAHYGRIYNNTFPNIKIKKDDQCFNLSKNRIFSNILAMKYLVLDESIWNKFFTSLQQLINNYERYIDLELIGFPEKWIQILAK